MAHHLVKSMARRQRETGATHHHHRITRVTTTGSSLAPGEPAHPWSSAAARAHPWSRAHQIAQGRCPASKATPPRRPHGRRCKPRTAAARGDNTEDHRPEPPLRRRKAPTESPTNRHTCTNTHPNHGRSRGASSLERRTWTGEAADGDTSTGEPRAATSLPVAAQRGRGPRSPPSPSPAPWSSTGSASGGGEGGGRTEGAAAGGG